MDQEDRPGQLRLPVPGRNGFGDQREEIGFREKVPLVPVVGKAAEIERVPSYMDFESGIEQWLRSPDRVMGLGKATRKSGRRRFYAIDRLSEAIPYSDMNNNRFVLRTC